jgi:adenylate cyclase
MTVRCPRVSLRVLLLTLLVGLLLVTVGSIAGLAFVNQRQSIEELAERHFAAVSAATAREVRGLLAPARTVLEESRTRAQRGLLAVDDPEALGDQLVERLRYERGIAWLSYSDQATGRFVGAWRRGDGAIVLNRSAPDVDGGRPTEVVVGPDGRRTPFERQVRGGYDPRRQPWYTAAAASVGVVWTDPFEFNEGVRGITAALALREPGGSALRGVFTADFFLDDLARFLADLSVGPAGRAFVLSRGGEVVAAPLGSAGVGDTLLRSALAAVPNGLTGLDVDRPLSLTFDAGGVRYAAAFELFAVTPGLEWISAIVVPEDEFLGVVYDNALLAAGIGLLSVLLAVALGSLLAYRIAARLRAIADDLEQAGQFKFAPRPRSDSMVREIRTLATAAETMKASLRSFGHYVPTEVVRELLTSGEEARLGGQTRLLTIHFSDVENFVRIGEAMEPSELVRALAEYLEAMTDTLRKHGATVDKFLGDGILAFFNAPHDLPDHATRACLAAAQAQERLRALRGTWRAEGKPAFRARIGLHTGEVLVGNIGTPDRFEYTVIGDAVNLASRLEGLNKLYGTWTLASQAVRDAAGPGFEWRLLDRVAVAGRSDGTCVSELLGERGRVEPEVLRARDCYEEALADYFGRRFAAAAAGFRAAAAALPDDRAAELMADRAEDLRDHPPADWTGIHPRSSK